MLVTKEQIEQYNKEPYRCVVCGSRNLRHGLPQGDAALFYVDVVCGSCTTTWVEVYKFSHIDPQSIDEMEDLEGDLDV